MAGNIDTSSIPAVANADPQQAIQDYYARILGASNPLLAVLMQLAQNASKTPMDPMTRLAVQAQMQQLAQQNLDQAIPQADQRFWGQNVTMNGQPMGQRGLSFAMPAIQQQQSEATRLRQMLEGRAPKQVGGAKLPSWFSSLGSLPAYQQIALLRGEMGMGKPNWGTSAAPDYTGQGGASAPATEADRAGWQKARADNPALMQQYLKWNEDQGGYSGA